MKILIDSLITKVRNSAKPGLLNTTSKLAYIENIRRTNLMSKKYYEYLKTLPFTFTFLGKDIIFTNKKRINEYNDLIDISFRDLIMDLTTAYNSCEIFDPTSGTYGKPSISIKS
jgi:hypothetical protein